MSRPTPRPVHRLADLAGDLAATHRATTSAGAGVAGEVVDADLALLERDGYVVLRDLISPATCDEIRAEVAALSDLTGRNAFEGHRTQRVYSVLAKTRIIDRLVDEPRVLGIIDRLLLPNYLMSQLQAINLLPGETAQLLHPDDAIYPVARPRRALGAATIWAIDDFTAENGATVVVPGSHLWDGDRVPTDADAYLSVAMGAGSCVLFLGTLWHGGGANCSSAARLAVTAQYCEPWLRPQEAFTLSVDRHVVSTLSEDLIRLLGYSIHPPFIGMVDGMHPRRVLTPPT